MKMKTVSTGLSILIILVIASCSKEKASPSLADSNGVLLAGAKGASKSWKLASISESVNGGTAQTVTPSTGIPACEADNIFQFSNNATQSYSDTEGATSCTAGDPATIESGSWAFTADGKNLVIDGNVFVTAAQFQSSAEPFLGYFILAEGQPLSVSQLTATALSVSYVYVDNSVSPANNYFVTLAFTAN